MFCAVRTMTMLGSFLTLFVDLWHNRWLCRGGGGRVVEQAGLRFSFGWSLLSRSNQPYSLLPSKVFYDEICWVVVVVFVLSKQQASKRRIVRKDEATPMLIYTGSSRCDVKYGTRCNRCKQGEEWKQRTDNVKKGTVSNLPQPRKLR